MPPAYAEPASSAGTISRQRASRANHPHGERAAPRHNVRLGYYVTSATRRRPRFRSVPVRAAGSQCPRRTHRRGRPGAKPLKRPGHVLDCGRRASRPRPPVSAVASSVRYVAGHFVPSSPPGAAPETTRSITLFRRKSFRRKSAGSGHPRPLCAERCLNWRISPTNWARLSPPAVSRPRLGACPENRYASSPAFWAACLMSRTTASSERPRPVTLPSWLRQRAAVVRRAS